MAALYANDLNRIERVVMTKKIGSGDAAALIVAAGNLSMSGVSVEAMLAELASAWRRAAVPAHEARLNELVAQEASKDVRGAYQAAIDKFTNEMAYIDYTAKTYAKIRYEDERIRSMRVHGETTKPNGYSREIEIDEIILSGTGE